MRSSRTLVTLAVVFAAWWSALADGMSSINVVTNSLRLRSFAPKK